MERASHRLEPVDDLGLTPCGFSDPDDGAGGHGAAASVGWPALVRMLIDCMPWPAALVADDGAIVFANRRAQACPLMRTLGWRDRPASGPARGAAEQPLPRALRRVLSDPTGGAVTLKLPTPGQPLPACVALLPLPETGLRGPQALVTVHDPQAPPVVDRLLLTRMFGLTPAEARVAARLVEGQSPEEISAEAGTSIQTVRSQLQAVFSKLAVNRQAMLVRMLLSLPSTISIPPNTSVGD